MTDRLWEFEKFGAVVRKILSVSRDELKKSARKHGKANAQRKSGQLLLGPPTSALPPSGPRVAQTLPRVSASQSVPSPSRAPGVHENRVNRMSRTVGARAATVQWGRRHTRQCLRHPATGFQDPEKGGWEPVGPSRRKTLPGGLDWRQTGVYSQPPEGQKTNSG
jgi:hypothetical protein